MLSEADRSDGKRCHGVFPDDTEIGVGSEIDRLRGVIIHRPGLEIEEVTPATMADLLYDDIVDLLCLQKEHDWLKKALTTFLRPDQVLEVATLLKETLHLAEARAELIQSFQCLTSTNFGSATAHLTSRELVQTMLTGRLPNGTVVLPPIPNLMFTRDIATVVGNKIIPSVAAKPARAREMLIIRLILAHHPYFAKVRGQILKTESVSQTLREFTIEGGDIMPWTDRHLLIGVSERTTPEAAEWLRNTLLEDKTVDGVTIVDAPKQRSSMHIDTIITRISQTEAIVFGPLVLRTGSCVGELRIVNSFRRANGEVVSQEYQSLQDLIEEITPDVNFIPCGGGVSPYQEREQWSDGCNLFALWSGLIIGYERNRRTTAALEEAGYRVVSVEDLCNDRCSRWVNAAYAPGAKMLILLPSSELSRGRGGAHCMTLPISRVTRQASRQLRPERENVDDPVGPLTC